LFKQATDIMSEYRKAMGLRSTLGNDINWISAADSTKASPRSAAPKK